MWWMSCGAANSVDARGAPDTSATVKTPARPPLNDLHSMDAAMFDLISGQVCKSNFHFKAGALYACSQSEMAEAFLLYALGCPGFSTFEMYNGTCEDVPPLVGGDAKIMEILAKDVARDMPLRLHWVVMLYNWLPGLSAYEHGVIAKHSFPPVRNHAPAILDVVELATVAIVAMLLLMLLTVMGFALRAAVTLAAA
jgi:hypothetical protein